MKRIKYILLTIYLLQVGLLVFSQPVPAIDENIPYLITFGAEASTSWGDDDFCQIFFFVIPKSQKDPVYLRVYDPDTGGDLDELKGQSDTEISYSIYAGKGCWTDTTAQSIHAAHKHKSGYLLTSKTFGNDTKYNKKWYAFGPVNPAEGEYVEMLNGYVFKIIAQGKSGDDGNIYTYFLSTDPVENRAVEGGNFFTYKYHFRLPDDQKHVCQIYPYVDDKTVSIEIMNFDWDNDGVIRVYSVAKNGPTCNVSGEDHWKVAKFPVTEEEKNSTIEIQFLKNQSQQIRNNNVVVAIRNQYGVSLPFYVIPIGGVPVYAPKIRMVQ